MFRKIILAFYFVIIGLLIIGCQKEVKLENKLEEASASGVEIEGNLTFDDSLRPAWWETLDNTDYLYSYAYSDGSDQEKIKLEAITSAQSKFLSINKKYVVNLAELVIKESNSQDKFKSNSITTKNGVIYKKDYSRYLKRLETEYVSKNESEFRCFVAVGLPVAEIQKEFVNQYQKSKPMASAFANSDTYRYMLKIAGLEVPVLQEIVEQKAIKQEEPKKTEVKYDQDVIPAWFKVSYNNLKVMVNQTATGTSTKQAEEKAIALCESNKLKAANNFARAEAEKYRAASEYDEIQFAELKNKISQEVNRINFPLTKEHLKTIQIGENNYKTYAQYSVNKKSIQNALIEVLKSDDILYSRLRASMAFDDLDNEDF
ncbi:hypothetical protein JEZ13_09225 [bacterium]|nr:hypothetical protein [bacterium]